MLRHFFILINLTLSASAFAESAPWAHPNGPAPTGVEAAMNYLNQTDWQLEILLSFANHKKGSAGHLALAVRDPGTAEVLVHSANFYADRSEEHSPEKYYTDDLVMAIPKDEYIWGVHSSISPKAHFGLDFGEIFKRALIGIRLYGISEQEVAGIQDFYQRLNEDYRAQKSNTEYQRGAVVYDYMNLNCAKSVAQALRYGAGIKDIRIKGNHVFNALPGAKYLFAHTPTSTTLQILEVLAERGVKMDAILYRRNEESTFMNDDPAIPFHQLPNRFPSVKSLDFFNGSTQFEDWDNLYAMNLFYQLGSAAFSLPDQAHGVILEKEKPALSYEEARQVEKDQADNDSKNLLRRLIRAMGLKLTKDNDTLGMYDPDAEESQRTALFEALYSEN